MAVVLLLTVLSLVNNPSEAAGSVAHVLVVVSSNSPFYQPPLQGFEQGLIKREQANELKLNFQQYIITGNKKQDTARLSQLLQAKPVLIATIGSDATLDIAALHPSVPTLFCMILNPVSLGVAHSLHAPGGNFTGTTLLIDPGKQLETLQIADPLVKRVGVLYSPNDPTSASFVAQADMEAKTLGMAVVAEPVSQSTAPQQALNALKGKVDALWVIADLASTGSSALEATLNFAQKGKLPVLGLSQVTVEQGALLALSPDYQKLGDLTAEMAAAVLSGGMQPANMPVRSPRATVLAINIKTARALQLNLPADLLHLADVVTNGGGH